MPAGEKMAAQGLTLPAAEAAAAAEAVHQKHTHQLSLVHRS